MAGFAFNSYQSERNRKLLDNLREAIFALKLVAQNRLGENDLSEADADDKKASLVVFLLNLEYAVELLSKGNLNTDVDLAFISLANRFILVNPTDVLDRLNAIKRLHSKLENNEEILERDFHLLDRLQSHLEDEIAQDIQGLFRL